MSLLLLNPILTPAQLADVRAAAGRDPRGHDPRFANQVATRDGEYIGALNICNMPFSTIWAHSEKCRAVDTMMLINLARSLTHNLTGGRPCITSCTKDSPIYPYMERFGFVRLGETVLFEERSVV